METRNTQGQKANTQAPAPYVVEPTASHTHTFILLHGLGSNGEKFGRELLEAGKGSDSRGLSSRFPGAKFIFPTARRRRSTAFRRSMLTQWFDIASLDDPSDRNHKQLAGLRESFLEILALVEEECRDEGIKRENVVLGGLSQGCAMALICLIAFDFSLGGFIGMSGWLPFQGEIEARAITGQGKKSDSLSLGGENSPSAVSAEADSDRSDSDRSDGTVTNGHEYVRDLLQWKGGPGRDANILLTPIFLGHGDADDKIKVSLGEEARRTICQLGFDVEWRVYIGQGHWYKIPDEIDDVVRFVCEKCKWESDQIY